MEPRVVTVPIPAQQSDVDPGRVHTWLSEQSVAVSAVSIRYTNGERELLIQTDADVAPLFANWGAVPRSELRTAMRAYRFASQNLLQSAAPIPAGVLKQWVQALNDLLQVSDGKLRDDGG